MTIALLTAGDFDQKIAAHEMVLVDFSAHWCGPCRAFGEVYEALSLQYPEILFAKVDVDQERQLAKDFQVHSIPTLVVFRRGVVVYAAAGALGQSALAEVIAKANALNVKEIFSASAEGNADESC